jgi:hypothetical protein
MTASKTDDQIVGERRGSLQRWWSVGLETKALIEQTECGSKEVLAK